MNKPKRKSKPVDVMSRFLHYSSLRVIPDGDEFVAASEALGNGQTLVLDTATGIAYQGFVSGGTTYCGHIRGDIACFLGLRTR